MRKAQQISRELCNNIENIRPKRKLKKKNKQVVKKHDETVNEPITKENTLGGDAEEVHPEK